MSAEKKTWHGISREEIPWLPAVDAEACIGCQLCYVTCGRGVYEMHEGIAVAVSAMECAAKRTFAPVNSLRGSVPTFPFGRTP